MHNGANRNIFERKGVPHPDRDILSRGNRVTHSQTFRRDDITPFAISIEQQRDVCASVGIVFQTLYLRGNAVLFAGEINNAIVAFVTAAAMADGDPAGIVPAIGRTLGFCKCGDRSAFVQAGRDHPDHSPAPGRSRFLFNDWHNGYP
jgi:hypothetical protein